MSQPLPQGVYVNATGAANAAVTTTATTTFPNTNPYTVATGVMSMHNINVTSQAPRPEEQWQFESGLVRDGDLSKVEALYPERFLERSQATLFHFSVWQTIHEEYKDYGFLQLMVASTMADQDFYHSQRLLVFGSKQTRSAFRRWWKRYQRYYDEDTIIVQCLPSPKSSKRVRGAVIPFPMEHDDYEKHAVFQTKTLGAQARDVWAWIVSNSRDRVWRVPGAFIFAHDTDAVAFKLRWV